jgi:hypothetical protein
VHFDTQPAMTTNQAAIATLFQHMKRYVGNLRQSQASFPSILRQSKMVLMRCRAAHRRACVDRLSRLVQSGNPESTAECSLRAATTSADRRLDSNLGVLGENRRSLSLGTHSRDPMVSPPATLRQTSFASIRESCGHDWGASFSIRIA